MRNKFSNIPLEWIAATEAQLRRKKLSSEHEDAISSLLDLCFNAPEEAYKVIMSILKQAPSKKIIAVLGAGPLEELLVQHCRFIENVIDEAASNRNLLTCLQSVDIGEEDCPAYYKIDAFLDQQKKSGKLPRKGYD